MKYSSWCYIHEIAKVANARTGGYYCRVCWLKKEQGGFMPKSCQATKKYIPIMVQSGGMAAGMCRSSGGYIGTECIKKCMEEVECLLQMYPAYRNNGIYILNTHTNKIAAHIGPPKPADLPWKCVERAEYVEESTGPAKEDRRDTD